MKAKLFIIAIILVSLSISSVCASDVDNQSINQISLFNKQMVSIKQKLQQMRILL